MGAETKSSGFACSVRRFSSKDANAVTGIFRESPQAGIWAPEGYGRTPHWAGPLALVSEFAGEVTGYLLGREVLDEAEVLHLAVRSKFRRQGHARALVSSALAGMRSRGIQRVFLEVRDSNVVAIALYEGLGFLKTGKRAAYYRDPVEAAVLMEKKLGD
jgi:ribosomal-protein-alanine acetyltransferase